RPDVAGAASAAGALRDGSPRRPAALPLRTRALCDGAYQYVGKVGRDFTEEEGREAARLTALNMLATLKAELSDLGRVRRVVKLLGMANCTEDFVRMPDVINGASDLFVAVFGDA